MSQNTLPEPPLASVHRWSIGEVALAGLLLLAAGFLRWRASLGEFWLDEVWTWEISQKLTWPGGLFYQLQEENNHYLNTLWIWLLGQNAWWGWYRLLPVLCGTISVGLAWQLAAPASTPKSSTGSPSILAPWIAAVLTASSYLLIHYSSEARGYAYAVLFSGWSFLELPRAIEDQLARRESGAAARPGRSSIRFTLAACGGFLSQPVFLTCYGAMAIWALLRLRRTTDSSLALPVLWKTFFPSGIFFVVLYLIDLKYAANGGGDVYPLWQVILETLSLTGGGPGTMGTVAFVVSGLVLGAFAQGLRVMAQNRDDRWVFHLLVVIVTPLLLLIVLRRAEVYPRYFIISVFYLLQAVAIGLADLLHRNPMAQVVSVLSLLAAMVGNGQHYQRLAAQGRGGYVDLLQRMATEESTPVIRIWSDHDFRHGLMLKYWVPRADLHGKSVELLSFPAQGAPSGPAAPWLILHKLDPDWQPRESLKTPFGSEYQLQLIRPYAGLSGWTLALYRKKSN